MFFIPAILQKGGGKVEAVTRKSELPKETSVSAVESLLEIIKKTLKSGEDLSISGFGKSMVKEKEKGGGRKLQAGKTDR